VQSDTTINEETIRPLNKKIQDTTSKNEIRFSIYEPAQLSVEINNNIKRPLLIFANALEKNIPSKKDKNVLFFEAGKIYDTGLVQIKSGQHVYIAGGAVIRGAFNIEDAHDVVISGRGIIDNSHYAKAQARPISITHSNNIHLDGFIITESKHWSCGSYGSHDVHYYNIKIVSDNDWDDGIDVVASQSIFISNCFLKTKDDCIAIKSGVDYFGKADHINTENVHINNCVFWNGVWGNALEIGFETSTDSIKNIYFNNSDIIHVEGPEGTLTIHNGDHAVVDNIHYDSLRIEDIQGYFVDMKILFSQYSVDSSRGKISNVYFNNVSVKGNRFPTSLLLGFDATHQINNIYFKNVSIAGRMLRSLFDGMMTAVFTVNIHFE